jgi:hypothetical protein
MIDHFSNQVIHTFESLRKLTALVYLTGAKFESKNLQL